MVKCHADTSMFAVKCHFDTSPFAVMCHFDTSPFPVKCHFDNDKKLSDMFFVTESQLDYLESSDSER